ncbi:MAG: aldehyde ferredoxin oxidoreductase family protein [Deltaproteobacteria bacterium]|nr:aldehyde ferredoxin oxidoreductase family protein [Candidatus Zymogenaceae bacterium]
MAYGYRNRILRINLTDGGHRIEQIDDDVVRKYLGGRGLALPFLLRETRPGIDPLSPENTIIFATGALTGAAGPAIPRFTAVSKSPLTGGLGASEAGGFWGPELKFAGYDALIVEGRAADPVYISIRDDTVEIRDGRGVWGLETLEAEEKIRKELQDTKTRVLIIGPGGERLVRFANIGNELGHYNGRNGLGAVMGSKNLKAVAVRGTNRIPIADEERLREITKEFARTFKENKQGWTLYEYGTSATVDSLVGFGALPTDNWETGVTGQSTDLFCDRYNEQILTGRKGCYACAVRCKRVVSVKESALTVNSRYGGPEYETIAALGSNCGIYDFNVIAKGNELANRYGLDTISLGMTISFAMKCYGEGLLTDGDTGGIELVFGNSKAFLSAIELIAKREGIGDLLAEGSCRAAEKIGKGAERYLITVKKQEVPMHDPRIKTGVGIGYAVSDIGADHMVSPHDPFFADGQSATFLGLKILGVEHPADIFEMTRNKARNFAISSRYWRMQDCLGCCHFGFAPRGSMPIERLVEMINAITGWDADISELMQGGERAITLSRIYNHREGFTEDDDRLPEKFTQNMKDGPYREKLGIEKAGFYRMRSDFYDEMGWDRDTGYPTKERIFELGIDALSPGGGT